MEETSSTTEHDATGNASGRKLKDEEGKGESLSLSPHPLGLEPAPRSATPQNRNRRRVSGREMAWRRIWRGVLLKLGTLLD